MPHAIPTRELPPPAVVARLLRRLQQRADQLELELASGRRRQGQAADAQRVDVRDLKDIAADAVAAGVADGEIDRDLAELRAVRAALQRVQQGGYGLCIDCDGTIGEQRLEAVPHALRCMACQARAEGSVQGQAARPA